MMLFGVCFVLYITSASTSVFDMHVINEMFAVYFYLYIYFIFVQYSSF